MINRLSRILIPDNSGLSLIGDTDRRNIRRNKKNGTYQTPEEQFKAMDKNNDGLVSEKERADYIREQRDNGNFLY